MMRRTLQKMQNRFRIPASVLAGSVLLIGLFVIGTNITAIASFAALRQVYSAFPTPATSAASPAGSFVPVVASTPSPPPPAPEELTAETLPSPIMLIPLTTATEQLQSPSVAADSVYRQYRVGLQVGHWLTEHRPEEAEHLRDSHGAQYGEISEVQVNYHIALRVRALLEAEGVQVDLLPATVPPAYTADVFVSLHADGRYPPDRHAYHGWKMAAPFRASAASKHLLAAMSDEYRRVVTLPYDGKNITDRMRFYNSFNSYRYVHAIDPATPAVIVEMAYLTFPIDREWLLERPDQIAQALAAGILRYLDEHNPDDTAARRPPPDVLLQPLQDTNLQRDPADTAATVGVLTTADQLFGMEQQAGWYFVMVKDSWDTGWVRAGAVKQVTRQNP